MTNHRTQILLTPAGLANTIAAARDEHARVTLKGEPQNRRHDPAYYLPDYCARCAASNKLGDLGYVENDAGIRRAERYLALWQALEATECETFIIPHWSGEGDTLDSEKDCGKKTCRRCQALAQAAEKLQEAR